jgi:hypothetical protein
MARSLAKFMGPEKMLMVYFLDIKIFKIAATILHS